MSVTDPLTLIVLFLAAMIAGGINAVAGGGTVISFPALVWAGVPLINANATNAFALVPGSMGSIVAYRGDLSGQRALLLVLLIPTLIGSLFGAWLVSNSPEAVFQRVVPFLILFATLLFAFSKRINAAARRIAEGRRVKRAGGDPRVDAGLSTTLGLRPAALLFGVIFQFAISSYGGYFGAGIGILMLSSFSLMGMGDIHRMNALKAALALGINGTAVIFFALNGRIYWPVGILMAVGALIGGYLMARWAKRINQSYLRAFVVIMGVVAAAYMFARTLQ